MNKTGHKSETGNRVSEIQEIVAVDDVDDESLAPELAAPLGSESAGACSATSSAGKNPGNPATMPGSGPDLSGLFKLFENAERWREFPAALVAIKDRELILRLSVCGESSKHPGTIAVTDAMRKSWNKRLQADARIWFGRIDLDGDFIARRELLDDDEFHQAVIAAIEDFAADPAGYARKHGQQNERCIFCHHWLSDDRSTTVGYGRTCASRRWLLWAAASRGQRKRRANKSHAAEASANTL
jgi:hypothetical protein